MKNIILKVDDETYRKVRMRAAQAGTSVSAMVREFLNRDEEVLHETRRIIAWHQELAPATKVSCAFRDSGFADDKANTTAILEQAGLKKIRSI